MRQAYTTVGGAPHLDGQYTVFGEVIEGMDTVERIEATETGAADRPRQDVRIIKMEHAVAFEMKSRGQIARREHFIEVGEVGACPCIAVAALQCRQPRRKPATHGHRTSVRASDVRRQRQRGRIRRRTGSCRRQQQCMDKHRLPTVVYAWRISSVRGDGISPAARRAWLMSES